MNRMRIFTAGIVSSVILAGLSIYFTPLETTPSRGFKPAKDPAAVLEKIEDPIEQELLGDLLSQYSSINQDYKATARPIFEVACFDCHFQPKEIPWYGMLPGIRQMLAKDISEAKSHLDMSSEFPFSGHGSVTEDLEEIEKVIREDTMPPWEYRLMHPIARLGDKEKSVVSDWLARTRRTLSN